MTTKKKAAKKAAKKKAAHKKSAPGKRKKLLSALVHESAVVPTNLSVTFSSGLGMITATLFQHLTGSIIGHDSLNNSGVIVFNNANSGDTIAVNGNCTGTAVISIDRTTSPGTPVSRPQGNINDVFIIL